MANRDTTNFRSSIQQTPEQGAYTESGQIAVAVADIGRKIIATGQEAKITENFSRAQLDIGKLNQQYQLENEGNPFANMDELKQKREEIFASYGEEISPFFRKSWQDNVRGLGLKEDAQMETWAFAQTRKNTVRSVNESIKNNLSQASIDGSAYGTSEGEEISSMLNFAQSKSRLASFGDKHLGTETTTDLLENYDEDYLKSFISGASESNPLKALRLMQRDDVKSSFKDHTQYLKMKEAVENRALNVEKINGEKQVLNVLKDENNMLTRSMTTSVSYADLQKEFQRTNMSPTAQAFFMKANGYTKRGEGKLDQSEQLKEKAQLYSDMTKLMEQDSMTSADVAGFQDRVYQSMDNGSLTEKEGVNFINQLVAPLIGQKEEQFGTFSEDHWFSPDVGFGGVQEIYKKQIEIQPSEGEDEVGGVTQALNNANQVKLYDYYMDALQEKASLEGVPMAGIKSLNKTQQRKLYADAQAEALRLFSVDRNPALSTLNDLPNQTFSNGQIIPGASGKRDLKPDFTAKGNFVIIEKNGHRARRYSDGTIEVLN